MEYNLPYSYLDKIQQFDNAVFYCMNASSERVPVGMVRKVCVLPDDKLEFTLSHFPVLENSWNVFAAELHFYKKGLSFNVDLHGTAWFVKQDELTVQFKILYAECFGQPNLKQYSLQNSLIDFLSNTGVFFKKMLVTGF
jgi:hypothetical protein